MAKRILVADDSATIQKAFAMVFAGQDVTLVPARSVDEAVSAAKHGRPDMVVADAAMGSASGYDLCAILRADPNLRSTPVYLLASQHVPYDEGRGKLVGANGHFLKPFDSLQIVEQVTAALARPSAPDVRHTPAQPHAAVTSQPHAAVTARPSHAEPVVLDDDDEYGELTIQRPSTVRPIAPAVRPAAPAAAPVRPAAPSAAPAGLRPSLIPGVQPPRPSASMPVAAPVAQARPPVATRTIMGLPTLMPGAGAAARTARPAEPQRVPAAAPSTMASAVAQTVAAMAARGPEYEVLAKLSREVIEQIVWEVVPELAEQIIRQEVDRLASAKR